MATENRGARDRLRVLHALSKPDGRTRYIDHMRGCAPSDVETLAFSWKTALFGKYDVLHVHWPEFLLRSDGAGKTIAKRLLAVLLMTRIRVQRRIVVRTLHNLDPHEGGPWIERRLDQMLRSLTTGDIRLNSTTPITPGHPTATILHGHYRAVPEYQVNEKAIAGRILYFGLIRQYKGVDDLLDAYRELSAANPTLRIVGSPQDEQLKERIEDSAARDSGVSVRFGFIPDNELAVEIARASLVVLPYHQMHNSGAALLALSMDRPVLAPRTPANSALQIEVGADWLLLYDGARVDAIDLDTAVESVSSTSRTARPDLTARDWERVGMDHRNFYHALLAGDETTKDAGAL